MTPVYQTKHGPPDGNCFAACVASLLDRTIEEVDVDVADCGSSLRASMTKLEQKANCKIYNGTQEPIVDGIVKTSERYCFAEVCTFVLIEGSTWHVVVCEIADDGQLSLVFNPDQHEGSCSGHATGFRAPRISCRNPQHYRFNAILDKRPVLVYGSMQRNESRFLKRFGVQLQNWRNGFLTTGDSKPLFKTSMPYGKLQGLFAGLISSGYHLIRWADGGMVFWAVLDLNQKELMEFVHDFAAGKTHKP
jgi:hypothetical protein